MDRLAVDLPSPPSGIHFAFMSLPRELRDKVYDQYFLDGVDEPEYEHWFNIGAFEVLMKPLGEVSRVIRDELVERFYIGSNRSHMTLSGIEEARLFLSHPIWCPDHVHHRIYGEVTIGHNAESEKTSKWANRRAAKRFLAELKPTLDELGDKKSIGGYIATSSRLAKPLGIFAAHAEQLKMSFRIISSSAFEDKINIYIRGDDTKVQLAIRSGCTGHTDAVFLGHIGRLGLFCAQR